MINFNLPPYVGTEMEYVREACAVNRKICGDGPFTKKCSEWLENRFNSNKILLTTSGTSALELAAILCDLHPGDEVILPSFTFSSTATAFQMVGATLVFVDVCPDTMNIDPDAIERAITDKTKVVVPVHYAGVACDMDRIMDIATRNNLLVVEDAAQGVLSSYKGKALGTIGHFGCYSFHETKNYSMGEGGALSINDSRYCDRAEIIREKGTNRQRFFRGQVDKYTWVDRGSSYLPSDMNAAYLWAQLEHADEINENRSRLQMPARLSSPIFLKAANITRICFTSSVKILRNAVILSLTLRIMVSKLFSITFLCMMRLQERCLVVLTGKTGLLPLKAIGLSGCLCTMG